MTLVTDDFDFNLPKELIAQTPLKDRSSSRMMVLSKNEKVVKDKQILKILWMNLIMGMH